MSTVKGAGRSSAGGADGVTGVGDDGLGVVDGVGRATRAAGRVELGPSVAGSAAITSAKIRAGRTRWRTGLTADRPLVLEGSPYQRLKDGFKQTEEQTEDQQEDQVDEEDARDHDPDQQGLREALHVEPNDLDQQRAHQQAEGGANRIRKAKERTDGNGQIAGELGQRPRDQRTPGCSDGGGDGRGPAEPALALAARLVLRRVVAVPALRAGLE